MSMSQSTMPSAPKKYLGKQALIIGASMSGLLAARVLADFFQQVTLIERDTLPDESVVRNGVPQGRHVHVLLIRGQQTLERFFPDLTAHLDEIGVPRLRWLTDVRLSLANGWLKRDDLNLVTRTITRPGLERIVRNELAKLPNIKFVQNCEVNGFITNASKVGIIGLDVSFRRNAGQDAGKSETLSADLIIDASGRNSKTPEWLKTLGYDAPTQTEVNSRLGYASRMYSGLSFEPDWKFIGINAKGPYQLRSGGITLQEDGQWVATMMGYGRDNQPPTDPDEYLAYAKSLPAPDVYNALKAATPLTDISGYAKTANVWHHYEKLQRFPDGLVVLGDAMCAFNPIYAQGMTIAALAAETLEKSLVGKQSLEGVGLPFQKRMAKMLTTPWLLATGTDFQFPETEGKRPNGIANLAQGYFERLLGMMHDDPQVARAFIEVMNMVKAPTALFQPALAMKVLLQSGASKTQDVHALRDNLADA